MRPSMVMHPTALSTALVVGVGLALSAGCTLPAETSPPGTLRWFAEPKADDPWSPKIAGWQMRERGEAQTGAPERSAASAASVSGSVEQVGAPAGSDEQVGASAGREDLRRKYERFRRERKRAMAREAAAWIQRQARVHYRPDGPFDHWATFEETLEADGDDCDGLELLVSHVLRDLGFRDDELYRAILVRPSDGQHHMVTLWFDDPQDPFVIDPTGAMTSGMPLMSEISGWVPLKVFNEHVEYSVEPRAHGGPSLAAR